MTDEDEPRFSIDLTGRVLDQVCLDLGHLRKDPAVVFRVDPLVWVGPKGEKVYRPPGIWCDYTGDRVNAGARLLFWFPSPYHPLEVLAAYRGLGGVKETALGEPVSHAEHAHIMRLNALRYNGWVTWTAELARALILFPAQVRVLYHAFTPLRTNGCEQEISDTMFDVSLRLYEACGFGYDEAYEAETNAANPPYGSPSRMQFWGGEVAGRIEL